MLVDLDCFNIKKGYYKIDERGNIFSTYINGFMKPKISKDGYYTIGLRTNYGVKKFFRVHRLVAQMFIPRIEGKNIVNHKDGNKLNNYVNNLEWCTLSENQLHSIYQLGNTPPITNEKPLICTDIRTEQEIIYKSVSECSRDLNCSVTNINSKLNGRSNNPPSYGRLKYLFFEYIE